MDTNRTFIVTWLNDKPLNIVTTFVQMSTLRPHTITKAAMLLVNSIVNDGLIDAVPDVHQTLLEFASLATAAVTGARHGSRRRSPLLLDQRRSGL